MKKLKIVVISLVLFVLAFSVTGCYSVVPQKMWKVKGTAGGKKENESPAGDFRRSSDHV